MRLRLPTSVCAALMLVAAGGVRAQLTGIGSQYWDQDSNGIKDSAEPDDAFGSSLAVGDFNCDGFDDLAIGVPYEDVTGGGSTYNSAGAVQIFYGSTAGFAGADEILTRFDATDGSSGAIANDGDHFGFAVAAYTSSDCGPRLAIGAPDADSPGHTNDGIVFLFRYSQSAGHFVWVRDFQQSTVNVLENEDDDQFGYSIAAVDFNDRAGCAGNNPLPGLAIGAPGEAIHLGAHDEGAVYLFRGRFCTGAQGAYEWEPDPSLCGSNTPGGDTITECIIFRQDSPNSGTVPESDDRFGETVSGRAHNRIIVGSPGENDSAGMVQAFYEASDGTVGIEIFDQDGISQGAAEAGDHFGGALAEGDFDGDGDFDLAVGVPGEDVSSNTVASAGVVVVIRAAGSDLQQTGDQLWSQDDFSAASAEDGDHFGSAIAAGDFDDDGIADLAIGALDEDVGSVVNGGAINVLYGSGSGLAASGNQTFTQNSGSIPGTAEECDEFGAALAAGNFDGALGTDLAIGVPGENGFCDSPPFAQDNEGALNVLYGALPGGILSRISVTTTGSVNEGAGNASFTLHRTGSGVISAGVHFAAANGTALANTDYSPTAGDLTWAIGNKTNQTVQVPILDDPNGEPDKTFTLELSQATAGVDILDPTTAMTIHDDDPFSSFSDDFENAFPDLWTSSLDIGNDFDQSALFPYFGKFDVRVVIDPAGPHLASVVRDDKPYSTTYHARFYLRLVGLTMAPGDAFDVFTAIDADGDRVFRLQILGGAPNTYSLVADIFNSNGSSIATQTVDFPLGFHAIDLSWASSTDLLDPNGFLRVKIDGTTDIALNSKANAFVHVDRATLGIAGLDSGTSGEFAFDEFASSAAVDPGQITAFADVIPAEPLWGFIHAMYDGQVTRGCQFQNGVRRFCGLDSVNREELAVLLMRAKRGPVSTFSGCTSAPFNDVAAANSFCPFIKPLKDEGITTGCGGGNYCPKNPVRRGELAVLLLRALADLPATSCAAKPFTDVETTDPRCPFIRDIGPAGLGISNGCGGGKFCPEQPLRRQELAKLLQRAFDYRLPVFP